MSEGWGKTGAPGRDGLGWDALFGVWRLVRALRAGCRAVTASLVAWRNVDGVGLCIYVHHGETGEK